MSLACWDRSWYRSPRKRVDSDGSRQVVHERAVLGAVAPEVEQSGRPRSRTARRGGAPNGSRRGAFGRGQRREVVDGRGEPLAVGVLGVGTEERELGVERLLPTLLVGPGDPDRPDQRVVLAEPDEHGGQHPGDRRLGDPVVAPGGPRRRCALLFERPLVLLLPDTFHLGIGRDPGAQVVFQEQDLVLQGGGEGGGSGHGCPPGLRDGRRSTRRPGGRTARGRRAAAGACR